MSNLDKIGERAAEGLKLFDQQGESVRADLQTIRDAYANAKKNKVEIVINGAKSWTKWVAQTGKRMRAAQYVLRGKRDQLSG